MARLPTGVQTRTTEKGEKRYRGVLNLKATGKQYGPWGTRAEAISWLTKARAEAQAGTRRKSSGITLREAWEDFYEAAKAGTTRSRSGTPYKPATLRGYKRYWDKRIDPEFGAHRLDAVQRKDVQALVDRWAKDGVEAATIRNALDPLRTIYRRAIQRDFVTVNPTDNLEVPKVDNARERFATREEAAALIAALPEGEQALWATAFYGGLRRGELRSLRWSHVSLEEGLIRVQRAWDDDEGDGEPKSKAAKRKVPIWTVPDQPELPTLGKLLTDLKASTGRNGSDLVFGRSAREPFIPTTARNRALKAWDNANKAKAEELGRPLSEDETLTPIGFHEARHTFASLLIAAGANAKALSVVMGHESITITFDRYGKLMPGGEEEVGRLLGEYLSV